MEDLEDYFRRMDEPRADANAAPPSVERFSPHELERLSEHTYSTSDRYAECAICLMDFSDCEAGLLKMPCAAGHLFHAACVRECLSRSVLCPVCRVDLRKACATAVSATVASAGSESPDDLPSPRQL